MTESSDLSALKDRLKAQARGLGFDDVGVTDVRPSEHAAFYRAWLERDYHGEMAYLAREDTVARRLDPRAAWPELRSAVVVGMSYAQAGRAGRAAQAGRAGRACRAGRAGRGSEASDLSTSASRGVIARYARGRDYHRVMKKRLLALLRWVEGEVGRALPAARAYVDTGPVLERDLARRAGLGWQGRNTMLIHPRRGSYFFLGSLLLELELEPDAPFEGDHCGTCNACVEACPTGALLGRDADGAPVMDARRCISYLTIEQRGAIPEELRPLVGGHVFGCDICQSCCPWNNDKFVRITTERDYRADWREAEDRPDLPDLPADLPSTASPSLVQLMRMTREGWDRWTRGSAIRRAGYAGFKRNVAVAMGNWLAGLDDPPAEAVAVLRRAAQGESELVREHAAWALARASFGRASSEPPAGATDGTR